MADKIVSITKKIVKLPKHQGLGRKGAAGRVLVIGGSENYTGAVYLAGMAALRSGADSVVVAAPEKVGWAINALTPDLVVKKMPGEYLRLAHWEIIEPVLKTADVVLLGSGAGLNPETRELLRKIMAEFSGLKVIDADAIKALEGNKVSNAIITPNKNESVILEKNNNISILLEQNNILMVKGAPAEVLAKNKKAVNKNVSPYFTKAGVGDILAGLAAGFLAQSRDLWQSAINATYFTGEIGEILIEKKKGYFYLSSEMIGEIEKTIGKN